MSCHVPEIQRCVTALDENDTSLLDLVAHTHGDLSQQRHLTGSTAVMPEVVDYPTKGECGIGRNNRWTSLKYHRGLVS